MSLGVKIPRRVRSLPSATKLQRLRFHGRVSVHGGGVPGPGGGCRGAAPGRVAWSRGGGELHVPGGCLLWGEGGFPACTEADTPPGETATAADGTHPAGMHSCIGLK